MPCLSCNFYTQPCLLHLGTAQECTPRNTGCRPRFGNNQSGNLCTFQSRVHFGIDRVCIGSRLFWYQLLCLTFGTHLGTLNIIWTMRCCIGLIRIYCNPEDLQWVQMYCVGKFHRRVGVGRSHDSGCCVVQSHMHRNPLLLDCKICRRGNR